MRYLRDSEVTPAMTTWAKTLTGKPLGYEVSRAFGSVIVTARVETHTNPTPQNPTPHPHPGVSLFAGDLDAGHVKLVHDDHVEGVDVSDYQGRIDWPKVKAAGKTFAWIKATEGATGKGSTQTNYRDNFNAAHGEGLLCGFYHYMRASDPIEQAKHFLDIVSGFPVVLPPVLDAEELTGQEPERFANACAAFLDFVDTQWTHPLLYTMPGFWNALPDVGIGKIAGLWVAHWTSAAAPLPCKGFADYVFWQYTASGNVPGINGKADVNRYHGTHDEFAAYCGIVPESA